MEFAMPSTTSPTTASATLLLRLSLGVMYLAHSVVLKLMTFTLAGTAQYFQSIGLPGWLAYATFFAEAVGGVLLILGVQSRWVALALIPVLIGAFGVHSGNGWVFSTNGGGWEYPLYLIVLSVAQALLGDGPYALSPSRPLPFGPQTSPVGRTA
jgi:putative oxidoreductase